MRFGGVIAVLRGDGTRASRRRGVCEKIARRACDKRRATSSSQTQPDSPPSSRHLLPISSTSPHLQEETLWPGSVLFDLIYIYLAWLGCMTTVTRAN